MFRLMMLGALLVTTATGTIHRDKAETPAPAAATAPSADDPVKLCCYFQLPTTRPVSSKPRWMSMSRVSPRQSTMFPGGGSFARAR
jgi:hypothetical protein